MAQRESSSRSPAKEPPTPPKVPPTPPKAPPTPPQASVARRFRISPAGLMAAGSCTPGAALVGLSPDHHRGPRGPRDPQHAAHRRKPKLTPAQ